MRCFGRTLGWMLCAVFVLVTTSPLEAQTTLTWDRNVEIDTSHYEMYSCNTSSACLPGTDAASKLGANIPQSAIGTKPTMPIPVGTEGRAAVLAVDLVGNKSGLSNVVPFDRKPPNAPTNLATP